MRTASERMRPAYLSEPDLPAPARAPDVRLGTPATRRCAAAAVTAAARARLAGASA